MNIKNPNIPEGKVKCVVVDANAPKPLFDYFDNNNVSYIKTLSLKNTVDAVSTHPDMQICHLGGADFVCEPSTYEYYKNELKIFGVNVTSGNTATKSNYPFDVAYNVVITGDFMLHNLKYTDKKILDYIKQSYVGIYNTKQGYTMCATCIINNNAVITDDAGIYRTCMSNNIECLLVEKDNITLGDRNDGFLGGCCGMIDKETLLFCGNIKKHKSYTKIADFAKKHCVKIVSAFDGPLTDVGSIIPVIQE